ncbi:MAG: carbohydrate kinase, partial [Tannerella sp.]|nr:carbohydrate kinase [Tannerella sp.]
MYLLGYDLGSSSVKASLVNPETGETTATDFFPKKEMEIKALKVGWAEQSPDVWWENLKQVTRSVITGAGINPAEIVAIGISYQMHGLVLVDKGLNAIRDSIIWCDSRAVPYGEKAFAKIGSRKCLSHLLNSPGNFTLSKLAWVKENEPANYEKVKYYMLPGDYIAMRMTGRAATTASGLSEGIAWDFANNAPA